MAGHSKWSNIKHRKAKQNSKREKVVSKIVREVVVAARLGGSNLTSNPRLRAAVDKAFSHNMMRNTLNRAIARGINGGDNIQTESIVTYEGYGSGGTAVMVKCCSDNHDRTASLIRDAFSKTGGNLSANGSVSCLFIKKGIISFSPGLIEDNIISAAVESGADDIIVNNNGSINVYTSFEFFEKVKKMLETAKFIPIKSIIDWIPLTYINLDLKATSRLVELIDILERCDNVKKIYHNGITCSSENVFSREKNYQLS
ncbi:DNA-binding regulatory protein, YebC/PmpR family [secondary endosymbiont of Heteropsylla cubana]|uniref:Probable transcriptional regulatory protein A35E_00028 n=1 Tax=secondary endosymbiont of Heteropsylla cubana TaxID=134287 RepID=J3Z4X1_9ENTR|nr:YebC/PmpR family DNA-binding transcriptional regulator [secondary endosymbiont of Heteropsylla cubana]AFP85354.1 DNA-binding regulatory protein, YebC/PmpR family [secondary endosymbiont of Heteropsylla cubana]